MPSRSRRGLLAVLGSGTTLALAGCTSTGDTDALCGVPGESPTPESTVGGDGTGPPPTVPAGASWTHRFGDAASTGYVPAGGPTATPEYRWRADSTAQFGDLMAVVAAEGVLVLADTAAGVLDGFADGTRRWRATTREQVGAPAVHDGTVYAVDAAGVRAFALADGTERWTVPLPSEGGGPVPVFATDEGVFLGVAETVIALGHDGTERWRAPASRVGAVASGAVVHEDGRGLVVRDAATGERRWAGQPGGVYGNLAVRDGTIYAGSGFSLYAVSLADGTVRWTYRGEEEYVEQPTVTPDRVYAPTAPAEGRDGGNLYALDRVTGEPVWCSHLGFTEVAPPAATDDRVFVATGDGLVQARDREGAVLWSFRPGGQLATLAVAGETLIVGSRDGRALGVVG